MLTRNSGVAGNWIVEDDVPLPKPREPSYPWKTLKVGQCLYVRDRTRESIGKSVSAASKTYGYKFTMRNVGIGQGVRIWRVA